MKKRRGGKKKKAIVLPLAFSPCGCLAADGSQKTTTQLQITLLLPVFACGNMAS